MAVFLQKLDGTAEEISGVFLVYIFIYVGNIKVEVLPFLFGHFAIGT